MRRRGRAPGRKRRGGGQCRRTERAAQPPVVQVAAGHEEQQRRHGRNDNPHHVHRVSGVCVASLTPACAPGGRRRHLECSTLVLMARPWAGRGDQHLPRRGGSSESATSWAGEEPLGLGRAVHPRRRCRPESWPTTSSCRRAGRRPPGGANSSRRAAGRCMNCAEPGRTSPGAGVPASDVGPQPGDPLGDLLPGRRRVRGGALQAAAEKSTAVTRHPCAASQIASAPSPQPTSSAVPGGRSAASATSCGLGFPLQIASVGAVRASQDCLVEHGRTPAAQLRAAATARRVSSATRSALIAAAAVQRRRRPSRSPAPSGRRRCRPPRRPGTAVAPGRRRPGLSCR